MSLFDALRTKIHYDPDADPSILERRAIREDIEKIKMQFDERQPATGMTLADMAANRRKGEHQWTTMYHR